MDERFGEWLRDAMTDIDDGVLKRRWSGIESLSGSLGGSEVLDLLLYSTGCTTYNTETIEKAKRAFWEHDNAFQMIGNDLELRRLFGATVIHVLNEKADQELAIALACLCLEFGGSYKGYGLPAVAETAESVLNGLSVGARTGYSQKSISSRLIAPRKISTRSKELIDEGHEQLPTSEFDAMVSPIVMALSQVAGDNVALGNALAVQKEETDILWWLIGACSNDLKQSFESMDASVASVVAGKELADHIVCRPGPLSVENIIHRAIQRSAGIATMTTVGSLLEKIPMDWRKKLVLESSDQERNFCPLHAAISYSVSVEDDPSWAKPFSKSFPHSTSQEVSPSLLGCQMYRERMLLAELADWR